MKLRGAGWLIGSAVTITVFSTIAACDDTDPATITFPDGGGITSSEGGVSNADGGVQVDGNVVSPPQDSGPGKDANVADANLPAQCNDGKVDLGETCDPLDKCPTDCAPDGCNIRTLENGGTCAAVCTVVAVQTQCQNSDGCCPSDCSIANDNDCAAVCGNGVKEAGEKCDGADCPTVCPPIGCQQRTLMNAGTCTAECVDAPTTITTCNLVADKCCPASCTDATDPDCAAGACGNKTVDPGETCDTGIVDSCPTKCAPQGCNLFKLDNAGTCQAACTSNGSIKACVNADGCCAPGCDNTNDSDCPAVCGNGVTEKPGETCDADCPKDCPQQGCQLFTLENKDTCTATCKQSGTQAACVKDDGCCPPGCTNANDNDCAPPTCGNGKLDTGETCDFADKDHPCTPCAASASCFTSTGSAATCDLRCNQPVGKCGRSDLCCPLVAKSDDCNSSSDPDCNGLTWSVASFKDGTLVPFKGDGDCVTYIISNVEAGGSYDVTTCGKEATAIGDVTITAVNGSTIVKPPVLPKKIPYGSNTDCDEKYALPRIAGFTCNNKDGKPTMACVAENTGGFITTTASDLAVIVCAVGAEAAAPLNVFYNAKKIPTITVEIK